MRPNRRSQDAVYVFTVGVVTAQDSAETPKTGEVRSSAGATVLVSGRSRDLVVPLLFSSGLLGLSALSQCLRWSIAYGI